MTEECKQAFRASAFYTYERYKGCFCTTKYFADNPVSAEALVAELEANLAQVGEIGYLPGAELALDLKTSVTVQTRKANLL